MVTNLQKLLLPYLNLKGSGMLKVMSYCSHECINEQI